MSCFFHTLEKKSVLQLSSFQVPVLLPLPVERLESSRYSRRKAALVDLQDKLGMGLGSPHLPHGRTSLRTDWLYPQMSYHCVIFELMAGGELWLTREVREVCCDPSLSFSGAAKGRSLNILGAALNSFGQANIENQSPFQCLHVLVQPFNYSVLFLWHENKEVEV